MGALKRTLLAFAMMIAPAVRAETVATWRPQIIEASLRFGVPARWIERVIGAESGGQTRLGGHPTTSRTGAMGLMQMMPATWREIRARLGLGINPHAPHDNIIAGTAYLREMYDRFGYPGLFAAYNAGPTRYAAAQATGTALPAETRAYLKTIGISETSGERAAAQLPVDRLFVVRHDGRGVAATTVPRDPVSTVFVGINSR